jgi:hypothetical protein
MPRLDEMVKAVGGEAKAIEILERYRRSRERAKGQRARTAADMAGFRKWRDERKRGKQ